MRALSAVELLNVWELGLAQSPAERALTLLGAACPEISPQSLTNLSVGERDARLMTLRERTFGSQLVCIATCARCGERLELSFSAGELLTKEAPVSSEISSLTIDGYELSFRLPNSLDLAELAGCTDVATGRQLLLERCISNVEQSGERLTIADVPSTVMDALVERMGQIDQAGNLELILSCPQCNHGWQSIFDIESFFWKEISAWANRILREVHTLASAYGWREIDVLNMTSWRRQVYLNLIGA